MNKVREGYKMTEIGEIPEEWEVSEIGKYIENISKKNKDLNIQHVVSVTKYNGIVDSLEYFDKQVFSKDISNYKIIKKDEFAYSTIHLNEGAIGYLKHCENAVLSPMYTVFKVRNDLVNNYFLYNLLKSNKYINIYEMLGEGSVDRRSSIPFNKFKEIKVAMPPIEEQEKISSILSTVDEQIDNVDALIEKNKELKKGLMQTLLTKGIGHTKFKKTEIGEIPDEWEVKQLGDIANYINGKAFKPSEWGTEGLPIVRIQNLNGANEYNYYSGIIDDKFIINNGQLLFAWSGSKGTSFGPFIWNSGKAVLNQHIFKVDLNGFVNSIYGYYALKQVTQIIEESAHGSAGLVHVTKGTLEKFKIGIPKVEEQIKIASILSEIDGKIGEHENKKQKLGELKRGLMQQLLTGKIRVI